MKTVRHKKFKVLEGWTEHAVFDTYQDANLCMAIMEEMYPTRKFDIWLDAETVERTRVRLKEGHAAIDDMVLTGHGFGRFARRKFETRNKWLNDEPRIRILRTIPASEEYPGINWRYDIKQ